MKQSGQILIYSVLLLLFLVPTFLINNNQRHDWGDDFAQYIHQSKQIRYLDLPDKEVVNIGGYGGNKRGLLFSGILSFVPAEKGIQPYLEIVFLFFILSSLAVFLFFCKHVSPFLGFVLTLSVYFNYHTIQLKEVVMTEFGFLLLLYFILWFYEKQRVRSFPYLMGILFALLCGFRGVGLLFFATFLLIGLLQKDRIVKEKLISTGKNLLAFLLTFAGYNLFLISHHKNSELSYYSSIFFDRLSFSSIIDNILKYADHFQLLFEQEIPLWLNGILFFSLLVFLIIGLINAFRKGIDLKLAFLSAYLLFLILYPYNGACIRFMIPVLPLFMLYTAEGVQAIVLKIANLKRYSSTIVLLFIAILLFSNAKTLWLDAQATKNEFGPYNASIQNDFRTIDKSIPQRSSIAFSKPFIINLFCKRDAYFLNKSNLKHIKNQADYVLLVTDERLDEVYLPELVLPITGTDTLELKHFLLIKTH